jgi:response regulator RpfG family c-di-GMP phosphodiesterase
MGTGSKKILIVDDSNTNIVLLGAILKNRGYDILTAMNVKEAYSILETEQPQLILLDLLMPHTNGFQFLEDIKKKEVTRNIPVIVVSAVSDEKNKKRTENLGATDYIEKPVDINELVKKVETSFSN